MDVLVTRNILHDGDLRQKLELLAKCCEALPSGGCLIVCDSAIDDARRVNFFGFLMSMGMLIETPGGFDSIGAQCRASTTEVGIAHAPVEPPTGP
jgi:hypothetical protein